jgi:hypothetical protein
VFENFADSASLWRNSRFLSPVDARFHMQEREDEGLAAAKAAA